MRTRVLSILAVMFLTSALWSQRNAGGGSIPHPVQPPERPRASEGTAAEEGKIEFYSQSFLVQVPVIVTDKNGNHVHGLTKSDVHVFENGKEQPISVFEEQIASNAQLATKPVRPGEFHNLTLSEDQPRVVTVIALDMVNTPFLDQTYGRRELVKFLANSVSSGQVLALMIITSQGLKIVQGLTGDPEQLLQALKKVGGETSAMQNVSASAQEQAAEGEISSPPLPITESADAQAVMEKFVAQGEASYAQFQQQNAIEITLKAFRGIAWELSGLRGRKSLIWATGGFPFAITSPDTIPPGYLSTLYERTMQDLTQAQVSVYPVDIRGLVNSSVMSDATRGRVLTARQINNRAWLQQNSFDTLDLFAEMTGGKAFYNSNDLASSFKRAADDGSSYYMLGYYLNTHNNQSGWRQLKVKIDKKDVEVRARKGFFVTNATIHMDLTRSADLDYAMSSPIEGTGIPVSVKWLGVSGAAATKQAGFEVQLPLNGLAFEPGSPNKLNFDFAVAAWSPNSKDGKPANSMARNFSPTLKESQLAVLQKDGLDFHSSLDLAPGQYAVRFVIRDNVTGKIGSVTAPLKVN
jgi:VWFA-related protein